MAGILITLALSMGMLAAIWLLLAPRRPRVKDEPLRDHLPAQLSVDERERLYSRLGLDPAAMKRGEYAKVIWLEPRHQRGRRSTRA